MHCSPVVVGEPRPRRSRTGLFGLLAACTLVAAGFLPARPASAGLTPSVDGNINDLINYAAATGQGCLDTQSLGTPEPVGEVCKTDASLIPCNAPQLACAGGGGQYFVNGYDLTRAVAAYDRATQTLYLGQRLVGIVGDSDGEGTPNAGIGCAPALGAGQQRVQDGVGIAFTESYAWLIDTDCDGKPDIRIATTTGADGIVGIQVQGAAAGATQGAYSLNDLEASVTGLDLPFVFTMGAFAGSTTDGLSEDITSAVRCGPPSVDLEIRKVAEPSKICAGQTTYFTISVQNTGQTPLTTTLTDQLPVELTYNNDLSGDFTLGSEVAGLLTFNPLVIPSGATRFARFRVLSSETCFGEVVNTATATGTFTEPCIGEGKPLSVTKSTTATVTCNGPPCVRMELKDISPQCVGTRITIVGEVTNCSQDVESITVELAGGQKLDLGPVKPGSSVPFSLDAGPLECPAGAPRRYTVTATAIGDCEPPSTDVDDLDVECRVPPCVELELTPLNPQCEGTPVTISGFITNCSPDKESIVLEVQGSVPIVYDGVQPGARLPFSILVGDLVCPPEGPAIYTVTATASNDCQPPHVVNARVTIACRPAPCVGLVLYPLPPQCEGSSVTITGAVNNCGPEKETIRVDIGPYTQTFPDVQPGESRPLELFVGTLDCPPTGGPAVYVAVATATTDCGTISTTQTVEIECQSPPCVELSLRPLDPRCEGQPVTIQGSVRNCGEDAASIVVQLTGGGSVDLGIVPAGESRSFEIPAGVVDCGPDGTATYTVTATATGECQPPATDTEDVTVSCSAGPCVELTLTPIPPQCTGAVITICGYVHNCSTSPENIVVGVTGGGSVDLGTVDPDETVPFCLPAGTLDCVDFPSEAFTVTATARNQCQPAVADAAVIKVECLEPPCVKLKLDQIEPTCEGTPITITGLAENCGTEPTHLVVRLEGDGEVDLGVVQPGDAVPFILPAGILECGPQGFTLFRVTLIGSLEGGCEAGDTETDVLTVGCLTPEIRVTKYGPEQVNDGENIEYTITVTNPSQSLDLENVYVVDELCSYAKNPRNFGGTCTGGQPVINGNEIRWPPFNLPRNSSCTITFKVTADVAQGGAHCPTEVYCRNEVKVTVSCPGTQDGRTKAEASWRTKIVCRADNCPKPYKFWKEQCDLCDFGRGKFTREELNQIACCVNNASSFFNWPQGQEKYKFCRILHPQYPVDVREKAKLQFATLLANLCADRLNLVPRNGRPIVLDPSTPIRCDGLQSDTIGEVVLEVDQLLGQLEGQSLGNSQVRMRYEKIAHCLEGINTGRSIPVSPECKCCCDEHGHDDASAPVIETGGGRDCDCDDDDNNHHRAGVGGVGVEKSDGIGLDHGGDNDDHGDCDDDHSEYEGEESGAGSSELSDLGDVTAQVQLYRAMPNPFSATMSYAFRVPDGEAQAVEVGVYNVAGRLVNRLVSGRKDAGVHTVQWDGRSTDGARVSPGVYFVKSRIGSDSPVVTRVIYVTP